ncbi:hypothetical protein [Alkalihalobacillus sp. LMS39]|uniref:hypothetical protein n=1 Tax=Alkalihalobacillus sp. LMS39 TaxID=2924032 RepID=UPI001FB38268|nr:hypothetical protein [Alkalihalobacillus sp. LMS39]UOE94706.1 hypothetical protein MM271_03400 [Alkalihalobacillus sp. LMS39]
MIQNDVIESSQWSGGYYELSIEFSPVGDDKKLNAALAAVSNSKIVAVPISHRVKIEGNSVNQWYGEIHILDGKVLPCMMAVTRIDDESDWLDISIPQSAFEQAYCYRYPLTKDLNPWLNDVNVTLIKLAEWVFKESPFELAMIGEEITGHTNHTVVTREIIESGSGIFILPFSLHKKMKPLRRGIELSNGLQLYRE